MGYFKDDWFFKHVFCVDVGVIGAYQSITTYMVPTYGMQDKYINIVELYSQLSVNQKVVRLLMY